MVGTHLEAILCFQPGSHYIKYLIGKLRDAAAFQTHQMVVYAVPF